MPDRKQEIVFIGNAMDGENIRQPPRRLLWLTESGVCVARSRRVASLRDPFSGPVDWAIQNEMEEAVAMSGVTL